MYNLTEKKQIKHYLDELILERTVNQTIVFVHTVEYKPIRHLNVCLHEWISDSQLKWIQGVNMWAALPLTRTFVVSQKVCKVLRHLNKVQ